MATYDDSSIKGIVAGQKDRLKRLAPYWDWASDEKMKFDGIARPGALPISERGPYDLHIMVTNRRIFFIPEEGEISFVTYAQLEDLTVTRNGKGSLMELTLDSGETWYIDTLPQAARNAKRQYRMAKKL